VSEMTSGRRSRWTSDDAEIQRRASSTSNCDRPCPSCGQLQLTTVSVDGQLPVVICDGCQQSFGIDDSMDVETVARLYEQFGGDVVRMTAIPCSQCLNDDMNRFVLVSPDPDGQELGFMCTECCSVNDAPLDDWAGDGPTKGDDTSSMAEGLDSVEDDDGEPPWSDDDSGCAVDDRDVDVDLVPFSCRCGNNEVDCFETQVDPVSGDLSRVKCLACDDEIMLDTFFGVECSHCGNDRKELIERSADVYGRMTSLRCLVCDTRLYLPGQLTARKERMDDGYLNKMSSNSGHKERQRA